MTTEGTGAAFSASAEDVARALNVDPAVGLTQAEARNRGAVHGRNELAEADREPVWRMLVEAATEPFVLLLAAAGLLAILVGEVRDGVLVLAGLLPIVGADVITEYRGERALEALRVGADPELPVTVMKPRSEAPTHALLRLASDARLIVLGAHGHSVLDGALAGVRVEAVGLEEPTVESRRGQGYLRAPEVDSEHEIARCVHHVR